MDHRKAGPGRYWYAIAALIFLFGIGSGVLRRSQGRVPQVEGLPG